MFMKRSGGPKTELGKYIVSQNAIKHGAYAANPLLPGENRADYDALLESCFKTYKPRGLYEETLVTDLVNAMWRKARFCALQDMITRSHLMGLNCRTLLGFNYLNDPRRIRFARHIDESSDEDLKNLADSVYLINDLLDGDSLTVNDCLTIKEQSAYLGITYCITLGWITSKSCLIIFRIIQTQVGTSKIV